MQFWNQKVKLWVSELGVLLEWDADEVATGPGYAVNATATPMRGDEGEHKRCYASYTYIYWHCVGAGTLEAVYP